MLYKHAVIKGDKVDRIGKTGLIILLAVIPLTVALVSCSKTEETDEVILAAIICFITIALAVRKDKAKRGWNSIPMVVYTAASFPGFISYLTICTSISGMFYAMTMMMLSILVSTKLFAIQDDWSKETYSNDAADARFYLLLLSFMDAMNSVFVIFTGDAIVYADFVSRLCFYCSLMILLLPLHGLLNIRRIAMTAALFTFVGIFSYAAILFLANRITAIDGSASFAVTAATYISFLTMIFCTESKPKPDIKDVYNYSLSERLLKRIGWCIHAEEHANRNAYLESAFKRDFPAEYVRRFYCDMQFAEDIAKIQKRLGEIQAQRNYLIGDSYGQDCIKASHLEEEGADLLGKLSIAYDFNTGINECPQELLRTGVSYGGERDE